LRRDVGFASSTVWVVYVLGRTLYSQMSINIVSVSALGLFVSLARRRGRSLA
jgi:hypothetical protein